MPVCTATELGGLDANPFMFAHEWIQTLGKRQFPGGEVRHRWQILSSHHHAFAECAFLCPV